MSGLFIKLFMFLSVFSCANNISEEGYLFVEIADIYHNGNKLVITDENNEPLFSFEGNNVVIKDKTYEIIEEEHLYKSLIGVESYYPKYDVFILKAEKMQNGNYSVSINNKKGTINSELYGEVLNFKTPEQYILESYPNPTKDNPLRISADDGSDILSNYEDYTFVAIEIVGDWLKVRDDKECYSGEIPSEKDITGWIRWKKEGKIILDVRQIC